MSDEQKGGNELTPQQQAQEEYKKAWDDLEAEEKGEKKAEKKPDEGTTEDAAPKKDEGKKADEPQEKEESSKTHGSVASLEKALNDTKSYARKLEAQVQELRKLKESGAPKKEIAEQEKAVSQAKDNLDDIKAKVYEDYEELKDLFDPLIERTRRLETELETVKKASKEDSEKSALKAALDAFNTNVKPVVLKDHPDFDDIVKNDEYWKWVEEQRPALKYAASESNDPTDIVWALNEFKKSTHAGDIQALKDKQESERKRKLSDAQTLRGGHAGPPRKGGSSKDPNDYTGGFDEAAALLDKEGIRA